MAKHHDILKQLNPGLTNKEIDIILKCYLSPVNRKISACKVFKITVPMLGTIRTHGNKKKKLSTGTRRYFRKYHREMNKKIAESWTDEKLLY